MDMWKRGDGVDVLERYGSFVTSLSLLEERNFFFVVKYIVGYKNVSSLT